MVNSDRNDRVSLKLIMALARNDIKARYSNSIFGILWAFATPTATILVFWFVFQMGFRNPPVADVPYILWFVTAYIPWIFFTDALTSGCNCLVEYSYLVKKIRFRVEILPLVKVVSALFLHLFFCVVLCVMRLLFAVPFTIHMVQMVYYSIATAVFVTGATYLLSALTVFFKDTNSVISIIVQIGFWVTPVMWNEYTLVDENVRRILILNPMHYVVSGYRACFLEEKWFWSAPGETCYFWCFSLLLLFAGNMIFRKLLPFFADEV